MIAALRVQDYLHSAAERGRDVVRHPPFTLIFHPSTNSIADSLVLSDGPTGAEELHRRLEALRGEFWTRQRRMCFQFVDRFAPDIAPALCSAGFREVSRELVMICTPGTFRPFPVPTGISVMTLDTTSPLELVRLSMVTNERGFDPDFVGIVSEADAEIYRRRLSPARAFLAYLDGTPAGAGMFDPPVARVTELSGITTVQECRRRGVASALTSRAVTFAFGLGVDIAIVRTANEDARRVYDRLGFRPVGTELRYAEPALTGNRTNSV